VVHVVRLDNTRVPLSAVVKELNELEAYVNKFGPEPSHRLSGATDIDSGPAPVRHGEDHAPGAAPQDGHAHRRPLRAEQAVPPAPHPARPRAPRAAGVARDAQRPGPRRASAQPSARHAEGAGRPGGAHRARDVRAPRPGFHGHPEGSQRGERRDVHQVRCRARWAGCTGSSCRPSPRAR
jgi:hypothetical protein